MEGVVQVELPPSKRSRRQIDRALCLLCQRDNSQEQPVYQSKCGDKLYHALLERQEYGDNTFMFAAEALQGMTLDEFMQSNLRWHLSCYKHCTHKQKIEAIRNKQANKNNTSQCSADTS